jgi:alpha-1,2-glucosyltransferase
VNEASIEPAVRRFTVFCAAKRELIIWIVIGLTVDIVFLSIRNHAPIGDEGVHLPQVVRFMEGDMEVLPHLTVIPVYHAIIAGILSVIGAQSVAEARLVSFIGSAMSICVFYILAGRICPRERAIRMAQFVFLPILFPFFFLLYTDVWALTSVLWSFERALAKKVGQSAILAGLAIALRQPNLIWAVFIWLIFLWRREESPRISVRCLLAWLRQTWSFLVLFGAFAVFVILNGGVAVGDRDKHDVAFNLSNVWFFLLLLAVLFLPNCLAALRVASGWFFRKPVLFSGGLLALLAIYLATYHTSHPYNGVEYWFFLRNRLLRWTTDGMVAKLITFIPVVVGAAGFVFTPLMDRSARLLQAFSILSVVVLPLIEQRYYLVPLSLFLLLRRGAPGSYEGAQLICYAGASLWLTYGIASNWFFL